MSSTHHVNCYNCKKEIAKWSMYYNTQHKEEWECDNKTLRRKVPSGCQVFGKNDRRLKYEYLHCSISNHSVYCRSCAYKLKFKCKNCKKGRIKLSRKN
ncbi:hypothetical protein LCGC14_1451400 [marine sediment metagenome]|uniref:Uncharacterized protein n=1 Tax=marine sediment metagenome TaxID=412755 RepID=A0A0F9LYF8_9ZZZZ